MIDVLLFHLLMEQGMVGLDDVVKKEGYDRMKSTQKTRLKPQGNNVDLITHAQIRNVQPRGQANTFRKPKARISLRSYGGEAARSCSKLETPHCAHPWTLDTRIGGLPMY